MANVMLDVATELGAEADRRWAELDIACRLPTDLYRAAVAARLFRTLVPTEMGGIGAAPLEWFRIGVMLAHHEPSFGWVVSQGAVELGYIAAGADPTWAAALLHDPNTVCASSVGGMGMLQMHGSGATLSGRWRFNTGAHGATWIGGLARVDGASNPDGSPDVRFAWVPAERAEILDDWDPTGLRGTGSNSTVIPPQTIETAWTFKPFSQASEDRGPHGCLLGNGNWPIATAVAATQLGAARRAIDEAAALVASKSPPPELKPLVENASVQRELLRATGLWNAGRASVERELEAMWEQAQRLGRLSTDQRVSLFAANATASELSVAIINRMCEMTGTAALNRAHPLSRARRDAQALQGHRATNGAAIENAGKVALGLIPQHRRI
jgi:indole-3-acetate monooxygenase